MNQLTRDANQLVELLHDIVQQLALFPKADRRAATVRKYHHDLTILCNQLQHAVCVERSREKCRKIMQDLDPVMKQLGAACTRGEWTDLLPGDELNQYYRLHLTFRDLSLEDQAL